jgi:hypothetical protein
MTEEAGNLPPVESASQEEAMKTKTRRSVPIPAPVPPTPLEQLQRARENVEDFRAELRREEAAAIATVQKWTERLQADLANPATGDPGYALGWAEDAFDAAGVAKTLRNANAHIAEGVPLAEIRAEVLAGVIRAARSPSRSTSPTSNRYEEAQTVGAARLVESLDRGIRYEAKLAGLLAADHADEHALARQLPGWDTPVPTLGCAACAKIHRDLTSLLEEGA